MIELLQNYGLIGLFIGSFMASTIVPFSSEILLSGVLAAGVNPISAFVFATTGNWLGGVFTYYIGHLGKWDIIERWFRVKEETLVRQKAKLERYGALLAFFTWLPLIGDVLSLSLGFYRVSPAKSILYMLLGRAVRFAVWIALFDIIFWRI